MKTTINKHIERQLRFQLPDGYFHITTRESKSSKYFYCGTENQLDKFENDDQFNDGELIKFRVSDHNAICYNSWSHEDATLLYHSCSGSYELLTSEGEFNSVSAKEIAKEIAKYFCRYFK